jgi:hypothetical protein
VAQKKKRGGRTTPKGGHINPAHAHAAEPENVDGSSRYTPGVPGYQQASPTWVPVLMFVLLGLGTLVILAYYIGFVPGGRSNWYLAGGLAALLGGLYTATKYH